MKPTGGDSKHLRLYMKCQLCLHEWEVEGFGLLYDLMVAIEGCPSVDKDCSKTSSFTNRPSLQAIRYEEIDHPYAVVGEIGGLENWRITPGEKKI